MAAVAAVAVADPLASLRRHAVQTAFAAPLGLHDAIAALGFVQADPIRAPARAQDLILRQRVSGYRAGDLEAQYPSLDIEEDFLYAYGFLPRATWRLLHPKKPARLNATEKRVRDLVHELGEAHPKDLEPHLGARRTVNAWGGQSKASTRALEYLHYYGLLRIVRRERGIRVYAPARANDAPPEDRLRQLVLLLARIFAPVPETTLLQLVRGFDGARPWVKSHDLLRATEIDGIRYLTAAESMTKQEAAPRVRILAPFDPLVWDRRRFEHLWGWPYRFEAYTPAAKRVRGYYAMPLLWRDAVIGWVNAAVRDGKLDVETGFAGARPQDRAFTRALDQEIASLAAFLER